MSQYTKNSPLGDGELLPDPIAQLAAWLDDAKEAGMIEPTAMALGTSVDGQPSVRIVLFKGFVGQDLSFYTNYEGRKGRELAANPRCAATFWWDRLERQVRIEGAVEKLPESLSREYFYRRPRESQIGALTSRQSAVVASREELDRRWEENAQRHAGAEVPFPSFWGGYRLVPASLEFWQGRRGRLHDRLRYTRSGANEWRIERLEP
ncbi:pyridoxamine 5'-phosphate oxidase [Solimonas fluminis]|uniref:Pyridoxine/pyridoxamine 5'-phosphate oxidase n=1 Tax=Solimonas fluminis TaxID=2086571 RepID=A0A2S5TIP1_9GAMM|nr:pyridoxamine 5'-phosphate oxidase [Solimonas fluminis]PPE74831.1 pyridoxamine 5'-phosphate oxidase [Solimonas fluminis]